MSETGRFQVEKERRFSESIIWRLQRRFYESSGPEAWTVGKLPSWGTSNPHIAYVYARIVLAYLRDAALAPTQPVHIVEIGSGSGQFAYLFLKELHALRRASSLRALDIRYVMSDFTASNVRAWQAQPLFEPFLRAGQLHMGTFDAEADHEIRLVDGGAFTAATIANPLIVIANYVFDTLVHDTFCIRDGVLHEGRVSFLAPRPLELEPSRLENLEELESRYTYHPMAADAYPDPELNRILATYCKRFRDCDLTMPIGSLKAVRRLLEMAHGRLLLLCSDKGYTHEDELAALSGQRITVHGGAFSVMVNLHAIGAYFTDRGGLYASTSRRGIPLRTALFLVDGDRERFADTLLAFREHADHLSPYDYMMLVDRVRSECPKMALEHFVGLLRVSRFDPKIVVVFGAQVVDQVAAASDQLRDELRWSLERAWDNFYPTGEDLPYLLGRFFLALRRPQEAIRFNRRSLELFGDKWETYVNLGMCHLVAEDPESAVRCFDRGLELNPDSDFAKGWRTRAMMRTWPSRR
jgi:hypothetical protein